MNKLNFRNFNVSTDVRGVATVSIDVPGRPMNVISSEVMQELTEIIAEIEGSTAVNMVVFDSTKESGFLAGADVSVIAGIESPQDATRLIVAGQSLFQRIAWLPVPTLVVIDGPCMGGGLEWALACDYRIARNNSHTKIGLPEIKLGLIPGWGGTQRLPKLVGIHQALEMILAGKHLGPREALRIGLVDRVIDPDRWTQDREKVVAEILAGAHPSQRSLVSRLTTKCMNTNLVRQRILEAARRKLAYQADAYPALDSAIRAVEAGFENTPMGYQVEREEFVKLLNTDTSRQLLGLFFARENARKLSTWTQEPSVIVHETPIRHVGVIGGGAMGAGIAQLAAVRDFDVTIKELNPHLLDEAHRRVETLMKKVASRQAWPESRLSQTLGRIHYTTTPNDMVSCDLIIEAVVERMDVKSKVFAEMDSVTRGRAILATNTSSLSVTEMSHAAKHPKNVAGLHFFNPVHRMELVEVVRCDSTAESTVSRLVAFVKALGKTPVVTTDCPGFLVNRVLFPYLGEAVQMVGEGVSASQIDREIKRFGMPMGPLELLDQVGLDVAMHVAGSLGEVSHSITEVIAPLTEMVQSGHMGKKSSLGFYQYKRGKKGKPNEALLRHIENRRPSPNAVQASEGMSGIQKRLIYPMLLQAVRCHDEQVVQQAWAIDLAMVLGTGFAPFRGGPLHVVDTIGLKRFIANCDDLRSIHGDRFDVPEELLAMEQEGKSFFGKPDTRVSV